MADDRRTLGVLTRIALSALLGTLVWAGVASTMTRTLAAENAIVLENQQTGSGGWIFSKVADDANGQIKGYASATSVKHTENIAFHVTVNPAQTYTIDVYRIGWYAGQGGRLRLRVGPLEGVQQPPCGSDPTTGLIACDWPSGYTLTVPSDWTSGIYLALLTNAQGFQNYVQFVVRDDRPAPLLYQRSIATDQAYNNYPNDGTTGKSLYSFNSFGANTVSGETRAVKVSFDRPYSGNGSGLFGNWEINFVRWLERSGYDVTYSTDIDTHANGGRLLDHKAFLSVGQNEYWSKEMFDAAEAARDVGVSLGFFGAAAVELQTRFEPSAAGVADRVLVAYKNAALDPVQGATTTTFFRSPPVSRPEQTLRGIQTLFTALSNNAPYVVTNSSHWVYEGTTFVDGDTVPGIVGRQVDRVQPEYPSPNSASLALLSRSPFTDAVGAGDFANSSIYQAPSGAWVFSAGTTSWSWGLDGFLRNLADTRIQQTTANILNAFLNGAPVRELAMTAPTTVIANKPFTVSIEAKDPSGARATWYSGTVHVSSSDTATGVVLPPDSTLTNGAGTFSVTLATGGPQTLTASDAARSLSATASITVSAPDPNQPGLHVQGNRLVDRAGQPVQLRGVGRSGTEYKCAQGESIFDGPSDAASLLAIKSWGSNAVRVPLNEHCWLGINGVPPALGGTAYQQAIKDYVRLLNENGLYAVVELHGSGPGTTLAADLQPMPDLDHSPRFWSEVASAFKGSDAVILELFNEPFPDAGRDTVTAWTTWRDGGTEFLRGTTTPYQAVGMQALVETVRATGATNVIALGGVQFSNSLSQWSTYKPTDPLNNLVAAWHVYNFNLCKDVACFDSAIAPVAAQVPVVVTETGMNVCDASFWNTVLNWLDARGLGYLAWMWTTTREFDCASNNLIVEYDGTPTKKGEIYKAHLAGSTATRLALSTSAPDPVAGAEFSVTVIAQDQSGNTDSAFPGTVRFTSSDTGAGVVLPPESALTGGQATFSATLTRAGPQTITASDSATGTIIGTVTITVRAAGATRVALATTATPTAGQAFPFTVTALDQFGNTDTAYGGRLRFTSSDTSAAVVLPPDSTLTDGQGTFSATLTKGGSQTITATDTVNASITGTLTVTVTGPVVESLHLAAPATATAGQAFTVTVTARDGRGEPVTQYEGTVHFASSDTSAGVVLPPDSTLTNGQGTFSVTLVEAGNQTLTVSDAANSLSTTAAVIVEAASAARFTLATPSSTATMASPSATTPSPTAGAPFSFSVTALDVFGNIATAYAGKVHFTSSDTSTGVVLPADSTLTIGQGAFSATLIKAGSQTITATDSLNATIKESLTVTVRAASATRFTLATSASPAAGTAISFTVAAKDAYGNTATGYAVTVHFTSSDTSIGVVLPPDSNLTSGQGTFSATLIKAGSQTITGTDTVDTAVKGTLTVSVRAATATSMTLSAPSSVTAGEAFTVKVTLNDKFGNVATGYRGTIRFSASDISPLRKLPPDHTFTATDAGSHSFSVTLWTPPSQTITVSDAANSTLTDSRSVSVRLPLL
jgi:hypothetical protein